MGTICLVQTCRLAFRWMPVAGMVLGVLGVGALGVASQPLPVTRARLKSPLLVTQLPAASDLARRGPVAGGMLPAQYGAGARLCVVRGGLRTRILAEGFHSACDPAVSFDAKRILFAGKRTSLDPWNIYEVAADGSGLRQITRNVGNCRRPSYQSKLYTIVSAEPWYQITFVSDAAGTMNEDGSVAATDLYSCRLDGSGVRRLTFNPSSDMDPFLMSDGRLLFASWQRSTLDRGVLGRVGLFGVAIDGTDYAVFLADEGRRVKHMPCATTGGLAVFVEVDRAPWDGAGYLSCVRLRRPLHSYRRITKASDGLFHSPSPLPDGRVLVSRRPPNGSGTHGVILLDPVSGRWEPLFDDPRYHDIQATIIHPRPEPDGRSTVVTDKDPNGKLYCLNVYISDLKDRKWMPPGTARSLRVLEGVPLRVRRQGAYLKPQADRPVPARGAGATVNGIPPLIQRRILGEVPIEKDGSFNVEVPANTPVELQILDSDGLALRACSWIWAKNHEPRGCIGCHEDAELTPENDFQSAFEGRSVLLCPPPERRRTVDFRRDVMPIIHAKCVPCHSPGGAPPRLDGGLREKGTGTFSANTLRTRQSREKEPGAFSPFNRAYESLLAREEPDGEGGYRGKYVHPGRARTSPLVWHLYGRNTARGWDGAVRKRPAKPIPPGKVAPLNGTERRTFVEWIDLGAMWDGIPGPDGLPGGGNAREGEGK